MPEIDEEKVYNVLLKYKGSVRIDINDAEISLSLNPVDIHYTDSPDIFLWVDLSMKLFGQELKVRFPIPVEAEKRDICR